MRALGLTLIIILLVSFLPLTLFIRSAKSDNGLLSFWNFDEGSGTVAHDSSGNRNDGILCNGPTWVEGKSGRALSFDGVDDYVNVTENTDLDPHASNWTISAWVNIAQLTDCINSGQYGFVIVDKRQIISDRSLTLMAGWGSSATSQARFGFIFDGADQLAGAQTPSMNVFGWHYVAGVREGGNLYVYVDGAEYGPNNVCERGNYLTADTDVSSTTTIHLAHHGAWQTFFNGTIDEVRIYNRALSQQEIQSSMDPNSIKHYTDDFSVDTGIWTYCGNAYRDNVSDDVVLTEAVNAQAGGIWLNESLRSSFTVKFRYWVGGTTGTRTDGFVVKFYKQIDYSLPDGGYLGFSGLGYGIEFDTFHNDWDPSGHHVALIKDSWSNHLAWVDDARVSDDSWHNVTITVATSSVVVYLDSGRILSWNGTIDTTYGGFGFSGATGEAPFQSNDRHIIDDFSIDAPASQFDISITPAAISTSIGGKTRFAVTVENQGGVTDIFNLSTFGLNSAWVNLSRDSIYLIAGQTAEIELAISVPEDPFVVGTYPFCVIAQESLGVEKNASSQLTVFLNPIITNLEPENNTTIGSTDTLFSWRTSSNASSEVYIKQAGDLTFNNIIGVPGESHYISASNLTRNADYLWYAYSETSNGNVSSDIMALHVSNGISFAQRNYTFYVQRDYAQYASVSVTNNDTQPHDLLLEVLNPYQDLIVGFVGPGSVDENLTVASGEARSVAFNIFAQDAMQQNYTFTIKLTNLGPNQITDYALVNVNVGQPNINLTLVEESTDPVTLSKTVTATNYGDPITDLYIDTSDELVGKVSFEPTICHADVPTGGSLTFKVVPVLTPNFAGYQGLIRATGAGRIITSLQVNFTLPSGKSVYSVTIPRVSIEFSNYYDTDDSPNTNPLPDRPVESYLANGTIIFASQIIVDVCQNDAPACGANVSLTVWNETGTDESIDYSQTDFTGKAMFIIYGEPGNYSYQAELVGYGIETQRRSFSVDTSSLFEIRPEDITWLDVSDGNSTFDLLQNVSCILLDQAPFIFRARKTTIDQNATFALCLTWDSDKFKKIFVPGSIINDTLMFETSSIPTGNFSAIVLYYSNASGLSLSKAINIRNEDWSAVYLQGNYTYWEPFPLNATHFVRLSIERLVNSRNTTVAFDLYGILPASNNSLYCLTYFFVSNETTHKQFQTIIEDSSSVLYNNTFFIDLEPWKAVLINFTIPLSFGNGTLRSQFNATISSGSSFVTIFVQPSVRYIYDSRIWVGAGGGLWDTLLNDAGAVLNAFLPPPPSQAPSMPEAAFTCGLGIFLDAPGLEAVGLSYDVTDFLLHADEINRISILKKYVVGGVGATFGAVIGSATFLPALDIPFFGPIIWAGGVVSYAGIGFTVATTLYDVAACAQLGWAAVQAEAAKNNENLGECIAVNTTAWYCTNRQVVNVTVNTPSSVAKTASPELNVDEASLIVHFILPWPRDTYRNHNIHLLINNIEIGNLTNTIPDGYYIFPFNGSILNYASEGVAENTVTLRMDNLNGGHYVVSADMEIVLQIKKLKLVVVASNQTEANSIVEQLSGTVANLPDLSISPGSITLSNSQLRAGDNVKVIVKIVNFGAAGMFNAPLDLYADSTRIGSVMISYIPAFANQTIEFSWTATRGTHNITIVVNGAEEIPESDYSNNQAQTSITVFADDVAVANVTHARSVVGQGFSFNVSVTAANRGDFTETFNVTVYANTTIIASQDVTLSAGDSTRVTFTCNTTGFAKGNYTISTYALPVPGETDTADNNYTCNVSVHVGVPGDVSGTTPGVYDGTANMKDIAYLVSLFNTKPSSPNWMPNADVNDDGVCNMKDIAIAVYYFNQHE